MSTWYGVFFNVLLYVFIYLIKLVLWALLFALFTAWWGQGFLLYPSTIGDRAGTYRRLSYNSFGSRSPAESDLDYEEYFLQSADGVALHAWFLPHEKKGTAPTILFFHGNAGNIGNRLLNASQLIQNVHSNVFLVEYRGYGNSGGTPSEYGFHLDALTALDFLRSKPDIDPSKIFVFGRSLGGAVSIWLATQRGRIPGQIRGLIVENTFTSIESMVLVLLSRFIHLGPKRKVLCRLFLRFFMTSHWRSIDLVGFITVPTLFISGRLDELVPPTHMDTLFEAATCDKELYCVADGEHNDTYLRGGDEYYDTFNNFVRRVCDSPPALQPQSPSESIPSPSLPIPASSS